MQVKSLLPHLILSPGFRKSLFQPPNPTHIHVWSTDSSDNISEFASFQNRLQKNTVSALTVKYAGISIFTLINSLYLEFVVGNFYFNFVLWLSEIGMWLQKKQIFIYNNSLPLVYSPRSWPRHFTSINSLTTKQLYKLICFPIVTSDSCFRGKGKLIVLWDGAD